MFRVRWHRGDPVDVNLIEGSEEDEITGCRLWVKHTNREGYGVIYVDGEYRSVTRVAWEQDYGKLSDDFVVKSCRIYKNCINTDHLLAINKDEHFLAAIGHLVRQDPVVPVKPSCPRCGHEYTIRSTGRRRCKPCDNKSTYARRAKKKEELVARQKKLLVWLFGEEVYNKVYGEGN